MKCTNEFYLLLLENFNTMCKFIKLSRCVFAILLLKNFAMEVKGCPPPLSKASNLVLPEGNISYNAKQGTYCTWKFRVEINKYCALVLHVSETNTPERKCVGSMELRDKDLKFLGYENCCRTICYVYAKARSQCKYSESDKLSSEINKECVDKKWVTIDDLPERIILKSLKSRFKLQYNFIKNDEDNKSGVKSLPGGGDSNNGTDSRETNHDNDKKSCGCPIMLIPIGMLSTFLLVALIVIAWMCRRQRKFTAPLRIPTVQYSLNNRNKTNFTGKSGVLCPPSTETDQNTAIVPQVTQNNPCYAEVGGNVPSDGKVQSKGEGSSQNKDTRNIASSDTACSYASVNKTGK